MVYALLELPAGIAMFKVTGKGSSEGNSKLKALLRFKSTAEALESTAQIVNGELSKPLRKFLKKNYVEKGLAEELAVMDSKLGRTIKDELSIPCIHGEDTMRMFRSLRQNVTALLEDAINREQLDQTALGLAHHLNRYKLKFSPEKIDMMVIQAVSLLEDLDKEINKYAMRAKEWYGWHFPELAKCVSDNVVYCKTVLAMRTRFNATEADFSSFMEEEEAERVKQAALISMGTEIAEEDIESITQLCSEVVNSSRYREQLSAYLNSRMQTIAPNLTTMVGEQIGARLIQKAGSLLSLAKYPSSTVQILGAEKALFRALKQRQNTPKYGILYNAQIVARAPQQNKGTISRVLAAKASLSARIDSFGGENYDENSTEKGVENDNSAGLMYRNIVEARLKQFEEGIAYGNTGNARGQGRQLQQRGGNANNTSNYYKGGISGGTPFKNQRAS